MMLTWSEILIRLSLSACFGAAIGIERERKNWTAGLRTHMMVCLGATLTMMVSAYGFSEVIGHPGVVLDPSRVAAQVISGIGFIGAGTILFLKQGIIRGLTTASGLWTVAAIGLATGGGMYFAAGATTVLALVILWVLKPFEKRFLRKIQPITIQVTAGDNPKEIIDFLWQNEHSDISNFLLTKSNDECIVQFKMDDTKHVQEMLNTLQQLPSVKKVIWNDIA